MMTFKDPDTIETRDLNLIQTDLGSGISNTLIVEIIIDRYDPLIEVELYGFTFFTCQVSYLSFYKISVDTFSFMMS